MEETILKLRDPEFVRGLQENDKTLLCIFVVSSMMVSRVVDAVRKESKIKKNSDLTKGAVFCIYHRLVENLWGSKGKDGSFSRLLDLPEDEMRELLDSVTGTIAEYYGIEMREMAEALETLQARVQRHEQKDAQMADNPLFASAGFLVSDKEEWNLWPRMEAVTILASQLPAYDEMLSKVIDYEETAKEELIMDFATNFSHPKKRAKLLLNQSPIREHLMVAWRYLTSFLKS